MMNIGFGEDIGIIEVNKTQRFKIKFSVEAASTKNQAAKFKSWQQRMKV